MKIAAQIVGLLVVFFSLASFQLKKRRNIMLFQITASFLSAMQFLLLKSFTGMVLDLIAVARTFVCANNQKRWAASRWWLAGFILVMIVSGVYTWEGYWSVFAILGSCLSTVALWMKKEKRIRLISLAVGPCWIVYNLIVGAYAGALNEVLAMISILIGLWRLDRKKNLPETVPETGGKE